MFFVNLRFLEDVLNCLLEDCDGNSKSLNWSFELLIYSFYLGPTIFLYYLDLLISILLYLIFCWVLLIFHVLYVGLFLLFIRLAIHLDLALLLEIGKFLIQRGLRLFLKTINVVAFFWLKDMYTRNNIRKLGLGSFQIPDTCFLLLLELKLQKLSNLIRTFLHLFSRYKLEFTIPGAHEVQLFDEQVYFRYWFPVDTLECLFYLIFHIFAVIIEFFRQIGGQLFELVFVLLHFYNVFCEKLLTWWQDLKVFVKLSQVLFYLLWDEVSLDITTKFEIYD